VRHRKKAIALLLGLGAVLGLVVFLTRSHEPQYNGRSLSEWVETLARERANPENANEAQAAIAAIGTNAYPYLLLWLDYDETPRGLRRLARFTLDTLRFKTAFLERVADPPRRRFLAQGASLAISAHKASATAFVPDLVRIAANPKSGTAGGFAIELLISLQADRVTNMLPILQSTNRNARRSPAITWVQRHPEEAGPAIPILAQILQGPNWKDAYLAAQVLSKFQGAAATTVPAFIKAIPYAPPENQAHMVRCLVEYGPDARPAVPVLVTLVRHPVPAVRKAARETLQDIAPETLTNSPPQ
jgi:hypothetical protein